LLSDLPIIIVQLMLIACSLESEELTTALVATLRFKERWMGEEKDVSGLVGLIGCTLTGKKVPVHCNMEDQLLKGGPAPVPIMLNVTQMTVEV
jgi:hypothetical protein